MNRTPFKTFCIFIVSAILLAVFNSASLVTWTYDLEPGLIADRLSAAAEIWDKQMNELGPAKVTTRIRAWFSDMTGAI